MKIAQIPPLYEAVPPLLYGGTERVVATLCDALVDLGHEVTLFATAEARTRAELVVVRDQAIRLDPSPNISELGGHLVMLAEARDRADEFDVLHFHTELIHLPFFERFADRAVTTLHGRLDLKDLAEAYARWPQYGLVSISENQREGLPEANWLATAPHGLPPGQLRFSPRADGYLAFLGRFAPYKGADKAIEIARALKRPLKIAAKLDSFDKPYFETHIQPHLGDPLIDYVGEINEVQKSEFLGGASALLVPITWPEPFGLVMIEAMACGTPVVAFAHGAAPEIVEPGATGYLVKSVDEAIAAAPMAERLDRAAIRRRFELRFSAPAMARRYVEIYHRLLERPGRPVERIAEEPRSFIANA